MRLIYAHKMQFIDVVRGRLRTKRRIRRIGRLYLYHLPALEGFKAGLTQPFLCIEAELKAPLKLDSGQRKERRSTVL